MIPILLLFLTLPCLAQAAHTHDDFVQGFTLEIQEGYALQRLELPLDVHRAGLRHDLGDLRVFNGNGAELPMRVRVMGADQVAPHRQTLPIFPIQQTPDARSDDLRVSVHAYGDGRVLDVRLDSAPVPGQHLMLIDASNQTDLTGLDFIFGAQTSSMLPVQIRGGNDLTQWTHVAHATLINMEHPSGQIRQNRVRFAARSWKYYLVSGQDLAQLVTSIEGLTGPVSADPPRRWMPLNLNKIDQDTYEGNVPVALGVQWLDLAGEDNAILGVRVLAQDHADQWRDYQGGTLFRISETGRHITGQAMHVRLPERFRLQFMGAPQPLKAGWTPLELVFMPQGPGPYTLAVGNREVTAAPDMITAVLGQDGDQSLRPGEARITEQRVLGGRDSGEGNLPVILWSVLGLAVLALGVMAWRLGREMLAAR